MCVHKHICTLMHILATSNFSGCARALEHHVWNDLTTNSYLTTTMAQACEPCIYIYTHTCKHAYTLCREARCEKTKLLCKCQYAADKPTSQHTRVCKAVYDPIVLMYMQKFQPCTCLWGCTSLWWEKNGGKNGGGMETVQGGWKAGNCMLGDKQISRSQDTALLAMRACECVLWK